MFDDFDGIQQVTQTAQVVHEVSLRLFEGRIRQFEVPVVPKRLVEVLQAGLSVVLSPVEQVDQSLDIRNQQGTSGVLIGVLDVFVLGHDVTPDECVING